MGFTIKEGWHHGNVRGRNDLEDRNVVVLGSHYPDDDDLSETFFTALGTTIEYALCNDYVEYSGINGLKVINSGQARTSLWLSQTSGNHKLSRKLYLETQIQSLRSRFYWHDTKMIIVGPFALTDFGIAVTKVIIDPDKKLVYDGVTLWEMLYEKYGSDNPISLAEIKQIAPTVRTKNVRSVGQTIREAARRRYLNLPVRVAGDHLILGAVINRRPSLASSIFCSWRCPECSNRNIGSDRIRLDGLVRWNTR